MTDWGGMDKLWSISDSEIHSEQESTTASCFG